MTIKEAKKRIKKAGGDWKVFTQWMEGQTLGMYPDGSADIYKCDVERFIKYKCNPDNEPIGEFD